ncbi:MAG: MBL fold metallo-hydrolase [Candidatus Promineifilaceae bacterium]|nr:MBL fold metallo-hydrolase [Candidatus Promineifilaceae bacterium]
MKLTFLGTRGNIEARTRRHRMHTSLEVAYYDTKVMIDCGADWLDKVGGLQPEAILITHAHPDHAGGLKEGAPAPVYASDDAWGEMADYAIEAREVVKAREPFCIAAIRFEFFPVDHSTRAPAGGYRITAGELTVFYVPDVVYIPEREAAMGGAKLYIGDGATITRSMVRKIDDNLIGHTPIRTQLTWCQKEGVPRAIFTHCGSRIVEGDERTLGAKIWELAEEREVDASIAHDGMELVLR